MLLRTRCSLLSCVALLTADFSQRFVILGNYGVKVHQGEVTIAGATLTPIDDVQWVHAPHCHALPVLRTANDTVIELLPCPTAQGLRELARLNPLFGRLWNETSDTFQIVRPLKSSPASEYGF